MDSICSKVDGYGFERSEDFDERAYEEFMSSYLMVLARRAARWRPLVVGKEKVPRSRKSKHDRCLWHFTVYSFFFFLKKDSLFFFSFLYTNWMSRNKKQLHVNLLSCDFVLFVLHAIPQC